MAMRKLNINLSDDVWEWLDRESNRTGVSKSGIIALSLEQQRNQKAFMEAVPLLEKMMAASENNESDSKA